MITLHSCILSTITEQMETTAEDPTTREPLPLGTLTITISCSTEENAGETAGEPTGNLTLLPDSLQLCNILTQAAEPDQLRRTCITIPGDSATIFLPPQTLHPWDETHIPWETTRCYLKIYGKLQTPSTNNQPITICSSPMYLPISGSILPGTTTHIPITITPTSPLYTISDGTLLPAIQPIGFEAYVAPWKSGH